MQVADLQVIKDIPGFKVILKAVLKSQIQQMVEQLAEYTGEESVLLTVSVSDGSLSHLGSDSGKVFLEDHDDIKSQFLGFCLKRYHRQKQLELKSQDEILDSSGGIRPGPVSPRKFGPGSKGKIIRSLSPCSSPAHTTIHPVTLVKATDGIFSRVATRSVRHDPYPVSQTRNSAQKLLLNRNIESAFNRALDYVQMEPVAEQDNMNLEGDSGRSEISGIKVEAMENEVDHSVDVSVTMNNDQSNDQNHSFQPQISTPDSIQDKGSGFELSLVRNENFEPTSTVNGETVEQTPSEIEQGPSSEAGLSNINSEDSENISCASNSEIKEVKDIKLEAEADSEMDLEITGVEPGQMAEVGDSWVPHILGPSTLEVLDPGQTSVPVQPNQGNDYINRNGTETGSPHTDSEAQDLRLAKDQKKSGIPRLLPESATKVMKAWLFGNIMNPYPSEEVKRQMASQTNLNLVQINNWFTNARRRIIQPMLDSGNTEEAIERLAKYTSHHYYPNRALLAGVSHTDTVRHKAKKIQVPKSDRVSNSFPGPVDYHRDIRPRYDGTEHGSFPTGTKL